MTPIRSFWRGHIANARASSIGRIGGAFDQLTQILNMMLNGFGTRTHLEVPRSVALTVEHYGYSLVQWLRLPRSCLQRHIWHKSHRIIS